MIARRPCAAKAPLAQAAAAGLISLTLVLQTFGLPRSATAQEPAAKAPPAAAKAPAAAAATSGDDREAILLNFENADIREVIFTFAAALGINYWLDPRVQGQVTARSFGPIYVDDMFPVFNQILRSNGFAAIKDGELYSIVPAEDGKTRTPLERQHEGKESFVIDLVKVTHVSAEQIVTMLNPFVSPGGDVVAYPRNNLIIITDLASNAARLRDLVHTFDNDSFRDMTGKVYRIEHASLEEISQELWSILEGYQVADNGSRTQIIPLVRLNALAVIAFDPAVFATIEYWIDVLDVPGEGSTERRVYVYKVENSKAVDLADVLNEVYSGLADENADNQRGRSSALAERGLGLAGGLSNASGARGGAAARAAQRAAAQRGRGAGAAEGAAGGTAGSSLVVPGGAGGTGAFEGVSGALFEQEVRIVPDETTNALVILATPRDYQAIHAVLKELDIVPRQVLVEMLIAEVTLSDDQEFGVTQELLEKAGSATNADTSGETVTGDPGGAVVGTLGPDDLLRLTGSSSGAGGLLGQFSFFRGGMEVYRGVLTALAARSKLKVLSRPHIMTADNQEARILVGQEIPIITSQADTNVASTGGQTRFLQNVQYRDTGVVVSVTPQVNSEGLVNMVLSQEVSEVAGTTFSSGIVSPSFTTRETETSVVVQSGETIIIGGIIQETVNQSRGGVPFFMDIPFFGQFFRRDSSRQNRTELIVLITPYVVRTRGEARSVTDEFKDRVDDVLRELEISGGTSAERNESHTVILPKSGL
jgi:general secretion pathway protein D